MSAGSALLLMCTLFTSAQTSKQASAAAKKPAAKTGTTAHTTSRKGKKSRRRAANAANWRRRGQQRIDPQRAREIQEALIREHYLKEEASGVWDDASQKAMERYQADQGWQSKMVPDARALIKLGLGPDHEHLLNPQSAMTSQPPRRAPVSTPAPSPDPSSNNQPQR